MRRLLAVLLLAVASLHAQTLRIGILGTDSSHAEEFTKLLNDPANPHHIPGARVTAAYRGGNPALAISRDRIQKFSAQLTALNIPFVATIRDLCPQSDALLLLSVDPNLRLREFRQALACNKPIFVDKPFAPTYATARAMQQLAARRHIAWFSSSALRYDVPSIQDKVLSAEAWGPGALGEGYQLDLAWYGIHSIEMLYAVMGPGVASVARAHTPGTDTLLLQWRDGRNATLRLIRPDSPFSLRIRTASGETTYPITVDYAPLVAQIVHFFETGQSPVPASTTLEIFQLMDAAQRSLQHNGRMEKLTPIHFHGQEDKR